MKTESDSKTTADAGDEVLITSGPDKGKLGKVISAYQPLGEQGGIREWIATVQLLDHDALVTAPLSLLNVTRKRVA
jgi:hypothetical protein